MGAPCRRIGTADSRAPRVAVPPGEIEPPPPEPPEEVESPLFP